MATNEAFERMDSMYRYQRYFYDATRKFYLLGRDRLIEQMDIADGDAVAEIGCGTGRNLAILAAKHPSANFFGLDASAEMLVTAEKKLAGHDNVHLVTALAETLDAKETFGLDKPLDVIFFSYSITMIPTWREALHRALASLRPGGMLYIVDFYDQQDLPRWFRGLLKGWLRQFHVTFWNDLIPFLYNLDRTGLGTLRIDAVARRYAFIASFRRSAKVLTEY